MTQPTTYGGRPLTPAPGVATPELRVARLRRSARALTWSALVLIAVVGACGYFYANLPPGFENWMLLTVAAAVVFLLVLLPFVTWWSRTYTITTRRVIERSGMFGVRTRELTHVRGYSIEMRRSLLQRLWSVGTLTLRDGVDAPLVLRSVPSVSLVHEVLVDQVEVNQILAHRDAQPLPGPVPPVPPLPSR